MIDPVMGYWIVIGIAFLFVSAGIQKLRDLNHFSGIVVAYRLLPQTLARQVAWLIPCLELAVAMLLLGWSGQQPAAALPAATLLILYASGLAINLARGRRDLDCGCVSARGRRPIAAWMVWRNLLLALALGISALPWSPRALSGADLMILACAVTVTATLYAAVDRLLGDIVPTTRASRRAS